MAGTRTPIRLRVAPARPRQVIALGGGGFTDDPGGSALDDYILAAAGRPRPRICFLPTAGGDNASYTVKFYNAFSARGCAVSHLPLFNRAADDLRGTLLEQDVIYVGGGNTANMLAVWRAHGVDAILREAWERGIVLAGTCAGAMCWFEAGVTASFGRLAPLDDGLGILPGSFCAHHGARRQAYGEAVRAGMADGIGAEDGVGAHFVERRLHALVADRADALAHRVRVNDGLVVETPLRPEELGAPHSATGDGDSPPALAAVP